ncbi:MAG TPA: 4Fe-4S dicluster domain-containing protein [Planctomycetota bacterium]|nr:4Fe-4S dicluster domain-containing protein [Planctomycetota bacterium]
MAASSPGARVLERPELGRLLEILKGRGYTVVGPTVREGAIVYDAISTIEELPAGWTDEQGPGTYRLKKRDDPALFGYVVGPHSWKKFLFPPEMRLFSARRTGASFRIEPPEGPPPRYAFLGVRACELAAIAVQDRVFMGGDRVDPTYQSRREGAFLIAVNCGQAGGTCFCVSMKTGPRARSGFDLVLTEILEEGRHEFVIESGSPEGSEVLAALGGREAAAPDHARVDRAEARAAGQMGREMETEGIRELLYRNLEHPRWDAVAARCLACANCTMACPTCFCSTVEDTSDLSGEHAERWRKWDSCFTMDFSYLHGGSLRSSTKARYRQWMTHKLGTWFDQFGTSGCVGCGRCITWCPVGIDLTEEARAIRASDEGQHHGKGH